MTRSIRRVLAPLMALAFVAVLAPIVPADQTRTVQACAFADPPTTYEGLEDRSLYMAAMELAGNDMLFPKDPFFSQKFLESGTRNNRVPGDLYIPLTNDSFYHARRILDAAVGTRGFYAHDPWGNRIELRERPNAR